MVFVFMKKWDTNVGIQEHVAMQKKIEITLGTIYMTMTRQNIRNLIA